MRRGKHQCECVFGNSVLAITGNVGVNNVSTLSGSPQKNTVIFVSGNLTITSDFTTSGNSTLIWIVRGNINIGQNVATLHGFYVAEGVIDTASQATGQTIKLEIKGGLISIPSQGGQPTVNYIRFGRNIGNTSGVNNNNTPSESIIFDPKYYIYAQRSGGKIKSIWSEKAP